MKNSEKNSSQSLNTKAIVKKQYLVSVLVAIGITGAAIGAGYLIDQWQGSFPTYILIGFVISGPLSVWANYSMLKKKLAGATNSVEGTEKTPRL